jgi:TolB-like protein
MKGGALGTMASYNDYNGIPIVADPGFLTRRLRREYGFEGYVVSDSGAVEMLDNKHFVSPDRRHSAAMALNAGLNVRTDFTDPMQYVQPLRDAIEEGLVTMQVIDSRVRDVLRVKYWLGLFDQPFVDPAARADSVVRSPEHLEAARRAARESLVLLKNEQGLLPLSGRIQSLLVTGPFSDDVSFADNRYGPHKPETISILTAIRNLAGDRFDIKHSKGCGFVQGDWPATEVLPEPLNEREQAGINEAVQLASGVDCIVVCAGENDRMVGESRSRSSLDLPSPQIDLVKALAATGKPVVVVLMNGRPLTINWIDDSAQAILECWNPGEFGPAAIAEVLLGDYNPSGKLPVTFPRTVSRPIRALTPPSAHNLPAVESRPSSGSTVSRRRHARFEGLALSDPRPPGRRRYGRRLPGRGPAARPPGAVLGENLTKAPVAPVRLNPDVPPELEHVLDKLLAKDRTLRYQAAADLRVDLERLRRGLVAPGATTLEQASIVVVPFENLSPDPDQEYFCDGMTEEIIADLSKVRALRVISRTSAMRLKGTDKTLETIARELKVRHVLEVSVRKAGNSLRITAQLIDATSDTHLWAEKYTGTLDDVFEMQEKVSRALYTAPFPPSPSFSRIS